MMYQPLAQRLQQYEQFQVPARNLVKCRAVTSIDEAKAAMIDLDGSMTIFTDLGHGKIYTKQINLDGTATLNSYALEAQNEAETSEMRFETRFAGIENDITDYYLVMNMMINDYSRTARMYGQDNADFYFNLAYDFINDEDALPDKVARYFMN